MPVLMIQLASFLPRGAILTRPTSSPLSLPNTSHCCYAVGGGLGTDSDEPGVVEMDDEGILQMAKPKISGKIKLTYNEEQETERRLEVDADAYMAELRGQVRSVGTIQQAQLTGQLLGSGTLVVGLPRAARAHSST